MPIAELSNGTRFEYFDSHEVLPLSPASTKTTLIMTHGVGSAVELMTTPLFKCALLAPHGLRIIAYNRRGFGKSTPLTQAELACKANRTAMCLDYTTDLALFLVYVQEQCKPAGRRVLLGWSKAAQLLMGLTHPSFLPSASRKAALATVDSVILFEPPGAAFGRALKPTPELKALGNLSDPAVFRRWTTGHYQHPDAQAGIYAPLPTASTLDDSAQVSLFERTHVEANVPHGSTWCACGPNEMHAFAIAALQAPDVKQSVLYGGQSAGWFLTAAQEAGRLGVPVRCGSATGNHFFFLEEPKAFLAAVCEPFSPAGKL